MKKPILRSRGKDIYRVTVLLGDVIEMVCFETINIQWLYTGL